MSAESETRKTVKRTKRRPKDPEAKKWLDWVPENRYCLERFQKWLCETGSAPTTIKLYSASARWALALQDKPYWAIDPQCDILERTGEHIRSQCASQATWETYHKGLVKFSEFLYYAFHRPMPEKQVNWNYHCGDLPEWLKTCVQEFVHHLQRSWPLEKRFQATVNRLTSLTLFLRWSAAHTTLDSIQNLNVKLWNEYVDERLVQGMSPVSLNRELYSCQTFLHFLREQGQPVNERLLRIPRSKKKRSLPRDVSLEKLRILLAEIEKDAASPQKLVQRLGIMDRAAFLLMLHCGLRTCEIRFMKQKDINWERSSLHIDQSKGLKDRTVYLSEPVIAALKAYLVVRGPADLLPEHFFVFRHKPLSSSYFYERLRTYAESCGILITPHQLRHSAATLLLNAGAAVGSVQAILGHRWVSTTMRYIRVYDETVAADYYRAMAVVERRLQSPQDTSVTNLSPAHLLALLDALEKDPLNQIQEAVVAQLRGGIQSMAEKERTIQDFKVLISEGK